MQPSLAASQGRSGGMGPPSSTLNKSAGASSALHKSNGASSMIGQSFMSTKINLPGNAGGPLRPTQPTTKPFGANGGNAPHAAIEQQPKPAPAPAPEPEVYQELPDIDSEYSDSDDEAAQEKKQAAMPGWAKSPNLVRALQQQQEINPDDIFGPIPKLSIGGASAAFSYVLLSRLAESNRVRLLTEMFRNATSTARLRLRTSSARWEGTDELTQTDIARYHKAMGFRNPTPSNGQPGGPSQS